MFCKSIKNHRFWKTLIVVGIIKLIFGIVGYTMTLDNVHNINMLMGMFSGMGGAFITIGVIKLIRYKRLTAEKLREEEIELNDERNIQVLRAAYTIGNMIATILFVAIAFIFVWLDYIIPAFISIGAMYIQWLGFFLAYKYFNASM